MRSIEFVIPEAIETVKILGIEYSVELFKMLAHGDTGSWMRIQSRDESRVWITRVSPKLERMFDAIVEADKT